MFNCIKDTMYRKNFYFNIKLVLCTNENVSRLLNRDLVL